MSRKYLAFGIVLALVAGAPGAQPTGTTGALKRQPPAMQAGVEALLRECRTREIARRDGVTHYVVDKSIMGNRATLAYERFEAPGPDGKRVTAFRPIRGGSARSSEFSSDQLRIFGQAAERTGAGLSDEMAKAGFPPGMLGGAGADPWVSTDPRVMMGGVSIFLSAAADAQEQNAREQAAAAAEAGDSLSPLVEIASQLRLVGTERVGDRSARHLQGRGLQRPLSGQHDVQMVVDDVDLWIDSEECVPLRLTMAGTMTSQGQSRPMTIERVDSDYRKVAGSRMYEPYRQVMRMQGVMAPGQQAEMARAQAQMADMEKRLAQLPPAQRDMIMRQMGPQMAAMKGMASGGAFEVVTEVHSILVNPDRAELQSLQASAVGRNGAAGAIAGFSPPSPASTPVPAAAVAPGQPAAAKTPQKACLEEKIRERQDAQKKQQGLGRLLGAIGRAAGQLGGAEVAQSVNQVVSAKATADDLAAAARDLGITEDEIASCRNNR